MSAHEKNRASDFEARRVERVFSRASAFLIAVLAMALLVGAAPPGANSAARSPAGKGEPCVLYAELDGIVNSGSAAYLTDAVSAAEAGRCAALLIRLDTPGGMLDATRDIVSRFLGSTAPIIVWVGPDGARAGSAGMFITLAAHVATMANGSNIGAAHPVMIGGSKEQGQDEELARKIENDAAAFARAIAERRQRNVAWAEAAVRESKSITATEALDAGVIDRLAVSPQALLAELDGHEVTLGEHRVVLRTTGARLEPFEMTIRQKVLAVLGQPNLAYLLLMVGLLGVMIELYNPGTLIAGGIGGVALLLAAIGLNMLPVTVGGVALIAVAVALFVAEAFVTSYGALAVAGVAILLLGSALLLDRSDPDFFADASVRVSWGLMIPLAIVVAAGAGALAYNAARTQRRPQITGRDALIGSEGVAVLPIDATGGEVRVAGELWQASADRPVPAGARVRVVGAHGLTLAVAPSAAHPADVSRKETE